MRMKKRINNKKRLYKQYIRTRGMEKYPTRVFNFKRPKWNRFKKTVGTTSKYRYYNYEPHRNRYFIQTKYNFRKHKRIPKLTDSFINSPKAIKWNSRRKVFLSHWMKNKAINYDYGAPVPRNKPLENKEHEEILTKRFFAMNYRLGYLLLYKKYYFTYPEVSKALQLGLIDVQKNFSSSSSSYDLANEMAKGVIVVVNDNKVVKDCPKKAYSFVPRVKKFRIRSEKDVFFRNKLKKRTHLDGFRLADNFRSLFRKQEQAISLNIATSLQNGKILSKKIFKQLQLGKRRKALQALNYGLLPIRAKKILVLNNRNLFSIADRFNRKNKDQLFEPFKFAKRFRFKAKRHLKKKRRSRKFAKKYITRKIVKMYTATQSKENGSIRVRTIIESRPLVKLKIKKRIKAKKNIFVRRKGRVTYKRKEIPIPKSPKQKLNKRIVSIKHMKRLADIYHRPRKYKMLKRRKYLPFVLHDGYSQSFVILKDQRNLSRADCILMNARRKALARPSFLANWQ